MPNPSTTSRCDKVNFQAEYSWFEFRVFLLVPRLKRPVCPILLIAGERRDGFMPFPRTLA